MNTKESIREFLKTCGEASLANMVVALWEKQTQDEQQTESTNHHNNVGFTGGDAFRLTKIAKHCMYHKGNAKPFTTTMKKNGIETNEWMVGVLRKRLHKYAGQLAKIANERPPKKKVA